GAGDRRHADGAGQHPASLREPRSVPRGGGALEGCDEEGRYRPLQCHGSTGHCWCVDAAGQEIAGTRTVPGSTPPRSVCPGGQEGQWHPGLYQQ
uniref:Thyroglobulin type-1 domain-containing protein n=1 Tax=Strix occidentalis caurina TaxID=311401 RepID=A0A8D0FH99_STROC